MIDRRRFRVAAAALVLACLAPAAVPGADFPPITDEQRALDSVPGSPGAPAVVLFKNGNLRLMGTRGQATYSSLVVETRIKVLTEQGEQYGEMEVPHSDFVRLVSFEGRTVSPDGTVVPLPEDAVFRRTTSGQKKWYVTSAAFPAVEPGAILDARYELRFESIYNLEPWYFQEPIPTLHSEIVTSIPELISGRAWWQSTVRQDVQSKTRKTALGNEVTAWMDDLPGYLEEPASFPAADLSSRFMLIPTRYGRSLLLEDWKSASNLIADYTYKELRRGSGSVQRQGRRLAKAAGENETDQARAIYEFVRDEIETLPLPGVYVTTEGSLDAVLEAGRGTYAEKGLVLEEMLDAARLDPRLVWAPERSDGWVDLSVANPNWFERVLVRLELDGELVYLDPSDPSHPFGYLDWEVEGMPALLFSTGRPEVIELPLEPHDENLRSARVELTVGDDGTVTGRGTLAAAGHHATASLGRGSDPAERRDGWQESLDDDYPGFVVGDVAVDEDFVAGEVTVTWSLAQKPDEVLGDETEILPSRPLGPIEQRFLVQPSSRYAPVLLGWADRDESEVTVTWPEGWAIDVEPEATETTTDAGTYELRVVPGDDGRSVTVHRRFDTVAKSFIGRDAYRALRDLYGAVSLGDDQPLVLIRE